MTQDIDMDWDPSWGPRIRRLFEVMGLRVEFRPDHNYGGGSNPGEQCYMGGGLLYVDPSRTDKDDMLHEFGHHLEALVDRPSDMGSVNWGMENQFGPVSDGAEARACDLEVGIRILWHWPWRERASHLNLPDWWPMGWTFPEKGRELSKLTQEYLDVVGVQE